MGGEPNDILFFLKWLTSATGEVTDVLQFQSCSLEFVNYLTEQVETSIFSFLAS